MDPKKELLVHLLVNNLNVKRTIFKHIREFCIDHVRLEKRKEFSKHMVSAQSIPTAIHFVKRADIQTLHHGISADPVIEREYIEKVLSTTYELPIYKVIDGDNRSWFSESFLLMLYRLSQESGKYNHLFEYQSLHVEPHRHVVSRSITHNYVQLLDQLLSQNHLNVQYLENVYRWISLVLKQQSADRLEVLKVLIKYISNHTDVSNKIPPNDFVNIYNACIKERNLDSLDLGDTNLNLSATFDSKDLFVALEKADLINATQFKCLDQILCMDVMLHKHLDQGKENSFKWNDFIENILKYFKYNQPNQNFNRYNQYINFLQKFYNPFIKSNMGPQMNFRYRDAKHLVARTLSANSISPRDPNWNSTLEELTFYQRIILMTQNWKSDKSKASKFGQVFFSKCLQISSSKDVITMNRTISKGCQNPIRAYSTVWKYGTLEQIKILVKNTQIEATNQIYKMFSLQQRYSWKLSCRELLDLLIESHQCDFLFHFDEIMSITPFRYSMSLWNEYTMDKIVKYIKRDYKGKPQTQDFIYIFYDALQWLNVMIKVGTRIDPDYQNPIIEELFAVAGELPGFSLEFSKINPLLCIVPGFMSYLFSLIERHRVRVQVFTKGDFIVYSREFISTVMQVYQELGANGVPLTEVQVRDLSIIILEYLVTQGNITLVKYVIASYFSGVNHLNCMEIYALLPLASVDMYHLLLNVLLEMDKSIKHSDIVTDIIDCLLDQPVETTNWPLFKYLLSRDDGKAYFMNTIVHVNPYYLNWYVINVPHIAAWLYNNGFISNNTKIHIPEFHNADYYLLNYLKGLDPLNLNAKDNLLFYIDHNVYMLYLSLKTRVNLGQQSIYQQFKGIEFGLNLSLVNPKE